MNIIFLVDTFPKNCHECDLCDRDFFCYPEIRSVKEHENTRPEWCPLVKKPDLRELMVAFGFRWYSTKGGWNEKTD